ncbi:nitrite reductase [Nocardioides litoris]|uniref:nitrite reductase n=1 Tax=Nocardioides litoris TaxID=1926648 RepID=UPI001123C8DD|nr:nitrite reductase [Nocardioides litoris]
MPRTRPDRCPGALRPWLADDGPLVRLRTVGGELPAATLAGLSDLAATYGDGDVHLTARANLQLRAVDHGEPFLQAVEALGLLPSRAHDQARNVMVSPLTGLRGGRVDLRPLAAALDRAILADDRTPELPGRFLLVLDDGRGDLVDRDTDLGLMALDDRFAQLRVGAGWGPVVPLDHAVDALLALVHRFLDLRGTGGRTDTAPWHVTELDPATPLLAPEPPDRRTTARTAPPGHAPGHDLGDALLPVPDGRLTPDLAALATSTGGPVVVTPWHSIIRTDLL